MLQSVHVQVMRRALAQLFDPHTLDLIIAANVGVDSIWNQFGHHELHFDDNAFEASYAYIAAQRALIRPALETGMPRRAWQAFGRLTHVAQDFYSHSNYVDLWVSCQPDGLAPAPWEIDPLDDDLIQSPALRSGKPYLPFGLLSFIPVLGKFVDRLMPPDSHAHMHLDSAARGPMFEYAFQAATKRTKSEYDQVTHGLSEPLLTAFRGQTNHREGIPQSH